MDWDLCTGRDFRGAVRQTRLPAGAAKTGMYVRLVGGMFLRIERVERQGRAAGTEPLCTAAELMEPVWIRRGHE